MSRIYEVSLAVAATVVILPVTASTALGAVEVKTEPNPGEHCPSISTTDHIASGGCPSHKVSTETAVLLTHNVVHSQETILAICNTEFEGRINENGEGFIYDQVFTEPMPQTCIFEACREGGTGAKEIWPGQILSVGGKLKVEVTYCIQLKGTGTEGAACTLHIPLTPVGHVYSVDAEPDVGCENVGDERELRGQWTTENSGEGTHASIEIVQP